ncbi:MAG TPA: hypothetical protein VKM55_13655 [Candidatus Lokiarchaeia archaeon]|nr:hypothetical protein [Candidatus Lokiarchaeia archaeon]
MSSEDIPDEPVKIELENKVIFEDYKGATPNTMQPGVLRTILLIIPLFGAVIFAIISFLGGGFNQAATGLSTVVNYAFYIGYFFVGWYSIMFIRSRIFKSMQESYRVTKILPEEHEKLFQLVFGKIGIIVIIIIAVILCVYEFSAFSAGPSVHNIWVQGQIEGWYWDYNNGVAGGSSGLASGAGFYGTGAAPIACLILWWFADIYSACLSWYAIAFIMYSRKVVTKFEYRNEIEIVRQLRLTAGEEKAFIEVSFGFVPVLCMKFIAQIWVNELVPWWNDTITMFVILVFFVLLLILPSREITKDVKAAAEKDEAMARAKSVLALVEVVNKINAGERLTLKDAMAALLYNAYLEQVRAVKKQGSNNNKKIVTSLAGPVASYGAKMGLSGQNL